VRGWSFTAFRPEAVATGLSPLTKKDKGGAAGFAADWPRAPSDVPREYHSAACVRVPKLKPKPGPAADAFDDDDVPFLADAARAAAAADAELRAAPAAAARAAGEVAAAALAPLTDHGLQRRRTLGRLDGSSGRWRRRLSEFAPLVAWSNGGSAAHVGLATAEQLEAESRLAQRAAAAREDAWQASLQDRRVKEAADARAKVKQTGSPTVAVMASHSK
jgi:hypothetical protein